MARRLLFDRKGWTPERIRALRQRLGMTQEALAREIDCSFATVSRWENARHPVTDRYLITELERLEKQRPEKEGKS